MSASVTERARPAGRGRTATIPAPREADGTKVEKAPKRTLHAATQRAYARREERLRRLVGGARQAMAAAPAGRAKFVMLVMVLLAGGLVATLWLSTAAAADSYRLQDARAAAATLSQQSERLHREVAQLASAPELARRAGELGMVRVQDPARLVVGPDGTVTVVGEPRAATAPAPPAPPVPVPAQVPPAAPQEGAAPGDAAAAPVDPAQGGAAPGQVTDQAATGAGQPAAPDAPAGTDPVANPAGTD
jgi:hypothetical protein